ncbi:DUF655 domain-containing protein [Candidatus Nanopusillus massiliensis]
MIEERQKKPFESFKDIEERVKGIKNIQNIIYERIIRELSGKEKTKLFTFSFILFNFDFIFKYLS